jgi:hypothetical protein
MYTKKESFPTQTQSNRNLRYRIKRIPTQQSQKAIERDKDNFVVPSSLQHEPVKQTGKHSNYSKKRVQTIWHFVVFKRFSTIWRHTPV